ncbi:MAG: helix-turn-helix domain-containing protein [Nanoarchaeota archaeon]
MVRKISDKKTQLIQKLYGEGLDVAEIARIVNVSYSTAYGYTKLKQRINPETGQAFESISQLMDYQARHRINPETKKAFASRSQLMDYRARQRINPETGQAFESRSQYQEHLYKQGQKRLENKKLSSLIKRGLEELKKNQSWLARKMGVSRESASMYTRGKSIPNKERLERLFSALDVPYRTLEDLLEVLLEEKH